MKLKEHKTIVSISGGKDSTAMMLLAMKKYKKEDLVFIFCNVRGGDFPDTLKYLKYLEKKLEIKINRIKTKSNYWQECEKRGGFPSWHMRWCTGQKIDSIRDWIRKRYCLKTCMIWTGERREESKERSKLEYNYYHKRICMDGYRPMLDWKVGEIKSYIQDHGLELHPAYKYFDRMSCFCCPLNTNAAWISLYSHYRKLFNKCVRYEKKIKVPIRRKEFLEDFIKRKNV